MSENNRVEAERLLRELEIRGYSFRLEGSKLRYRPTGLPTDLEADIRLHRDAIFRVIRARDEAPPCAPDYLGLLRTFAPSLWQMVRTSDERTGLVWGVDVRGVIVSFGPTEGLLTLDPAELRLEMPNEK